MEPDISPLAKRLAEENNVEWRGLQGSGPEGRVVERDVLEYLAKVMAGEADTNPTPEPVPEGMEAWPEEDVAGFEFGQTASSADNELRDLQAGLSASAEAPAYSEPFESGETSELDDDVFSSEFDADAFDADEAVVEASDDDLSVDALDDDADDDFAEVFSADDAFAEDDTDEVHHDATDEIVAEDAAVDDDVEISEDIFLFDDDVNEVAIVEDDAEAFAEPDVPAVDDDAIVDNDLFADANDPSVFSTQTPETVNADLFEDSEDAVADAADSEPTGEQFDFDAVADDVAESAGEVLEDVNAEEDVDAFMSDLEDATQDTEEASDVTAYSADDTSVDAFDVADVEVPGVEASDMDVADVEVSEVAMPDVEDMADAEDIADTEEVAFEDVTADAIEELESVEADVAEVSASEASPVDVAAVAAMGVAAAGMAAHAGSDASDDDEAPVETSSVVPAYEPIAAPHGVMLRRYVDVTALQDAMSVLADDLGQSVSVTPFLLRAVAKAAQDNSFGEDTSVGVVVMSDAGVAVKEVTDATTQNFTSLLNACDSAHADGGTLVDKVSLAVADVSGLGLDEAVLNVGAVVLAFGQIRTENNQPISTLTLSGDISPKAGAEFLAKITTLLASPVRLVL